MELPPRNRAERRQGKRGRPPGSLNRSNPRHPQFLSLKNGPAQPTGISANGLDGADEQEVRAALAGLSPLEAPQGADKPPHDRRSGGGRPRKQSTAVQIVEGFTGLYLLLGGLVMAFNRYDGEVIVQKSADMARALEQVARHNQEVYRVLARIAGASDYTAILMSYGGVAYAIAANHGAVPARVVGMFDLPLPPERAEGVSDSGAAAFGPGPSGNYETPVVMTDEIAAAVQHELETKEGLVFPGGREEMIARIRAESLRHLNELQANAARGGADALPTVNPSGHSGGV